MPAQPQFSSSCTMQPVSTSSIPPPPTSSGSMNEVRPELGRLVDDVERAVRVALVDLGRDRADLGARELARERLDLALLVGQARSWWRRSSGIGATLADPQITASHEPADTLGTRPGEVAEWLNAAVSKTVMGVIAYRGFESLPLR